MKQLLNHLKHNKNTICAPVSGKIIRLENIPDLAFSKKMIGDGLAIEITTNQVIKAPCNGTISIIATHGHAFVMTLDDGIHLLIHIGLNSELPNSNHFHYHIKVGDRVSVSTPIVSIDDELFIKAHNTLIIPIIICSYQKHPIVLFTTKHIIKAGQTIFYYK